MEALAWSLVAVLVGFGLGLIVAVLGFVLGLIVAGEAE